MSKLISSFAWVVSCIINALTGVFYTTEQIIKFFLHPMDTLNKL